MCVKITGKPVLKSWRQGSLHSKLELITFPVVCEIHSSSVVVVCLHLEGGTLDDPIRARDIALAFPRIGL